MSLAVESTSKDWTGRRHSVAWIDLLFIWSEGVFFPDILVSNSSLLGVMERWAGGGGVAGFPSCVVLGLIRDLRKHLGRD
jgi:hypothetical protein